MKTNKNTLWFSILSKDAKYYSDEPHFINAEQFEWTKYSEEVVKDMLEELHAYLSLHQLKSYFNTKMSDDVKKWKTISLKWWGLEFYNNQKYFPKTTTFINSIPNLVSASFNLLEAQGRILPHCGDTNGIYRCHLGLIIPSTLPECGFRVETEKKSWKRGEWLIFIDAKEHEAWNNTEQDRYIFVVDIIRPSFQTQKNYINTIVLTGLFLQRRAEMLPLLYKLQNISLLKNILVKMLLPFCYIAIAVRNKMSKWGWVS